ncbi:hypothetical protein BLL52_4127 [Rhodoferax antarcticus ANT.BR]|uniref:Uncharacterized protein n=1 Tax=Rhodoferax antarcticus ANT.BR TaxID=1111071 RepID=A0A1Q8Y968_9BURK|nr:hypothetical protein BLL52_4127 [Rhodoferax antarcticus ANT.BR]
MPHIKTEKSPYPCPWNSTDAGHSISTRPKQKQARFALSHLHYADKEMANG